MSTDSTATPTQNAARTSGQWTSVGGTMVTVEQGEDMQSISRRYGVPEKALADINGRNYVAAGQQVLIPVFQQQGYRSLCCDNAARAAARSVKPE